MSFTPKAGTTNGGDVALRLKLSPQAVQEAVGLGMFIAQH
jgi:hypothetical protein